MKNENDIGSFSVQDFISDERFQDWVLHPTTENERYWQALIRDIDAGDVGRINQARDLLTKCRFKEDLPDDRQVMAALGRNLVMLERTESLKAIEVPVRSFKKWRRSWLRAAVIAGLLLGGYYGFRFWQDMATITISTQYGQTKSLQLPDGSNVQLNAHSSVTYPRFWRSGHQRELTMTGEAFFDIKHLNQDKTKILPGQRFVVHCGPVDVQVLGTRFDLRQYGKKTSVMLRDGRIQLTMHPSKQVLVVQPGELIDYDQKEQRYTKTKVDPTDYASWTKHRLTLTDATVAEVASRIEQYYGYHIKWEDSGIAQRKMEGTLLMDSLPDVLFVLSTTLNIEVQVNQDTLTFKNR